MAFRNIAGSALIAAMAVGPAGQAAADNALVGGIVGGIIGGVIVNEANKNRQKQRVTTTRSSSSGQTSATREANREVQIALNYFGFPVGTPDGAIGPRSRAAISEYQALMGYPPTGNLNTFERDHLVASYYRAQSGGALTGQQIASNPMGVRGLLLTYRDERMGVPAAGFAGGAMAGAGANPFAGAPAAPAMPTAAPAMPTFAPAAAPAAPALPSFMGGGAGTVSLGTHCSQIAVTTSANGGYMTQMTMSNPVLALSEQFCLARSFAIAQSQDLMSKAAGFTPAQITEQCAAFGPVLKDHVAAVSIKSRGEVLSGVQSFALTSGMAPAQLGATARTCLGSGYATDNMDVAIGSALILTVLGERAYGELVGHHLATGIGAAARADLSLAWYDDALGAPGAEVPQVFAPGMPDRAGLVRMAAYGAAGRPLPGGSVMPAAAPVMPAPAPVAAAPAPAPAAAPSGGFQMPSFNLPIFGGAAKQP
ncbi:MAG: peptidoglycan-binding protein [Paracoccaceae bacterium]|nr:MAG: peptidoglycan-binding protein [Paracoccaceae bacterium]